jgi:hypothetical protein
MAALQREFLNASVPNVCTHIKPHMPQPTTICLYIYHLVSRFEGGRPWFELETLVINVGCDYIEIVSNSVSVVENKPVN